MHDHFRIFLQSFAQYFSTNFYTSFKNFFEIFALTFTKFFPKILSKKDENFMQFLKIVMHFLHNFVSKHFSKILHIIILDPHITAVPLAVPVIKKSIFNCFEYIEYYGAVSFFIYLYVYTLRARRIDTFFKWLFLCHKPQCGFWTFENSAHSDPSKIPS